MKHLIICAHPNPDSLAHHFKKTILQLLHEQGHRVVVRDLCELDFDPVLSFTDMQGQRKGIVSADVREEQEHIVWADCITFIYPIWWTGMPAIMKGYIDRVMSYGFAYRYDLGIQKGLLTGKTTVIINTHGKSNEEYADCGMDKALSLTSDKGIYAYCGLEIKNHFFFGKADRADAVTVEKWTATVRSVYQAVETV